MLSIDTRSKKTLKKHKRDLYIAAIVASIPFQCNFENLLYKVFSNCYTEIRKCLKKNKKGTVWKVSEKRILDVIQFKSKLYRTVRPEKGFYGGKAFEKSTFYIFK